MDRDGLADSLDRADVHIWCCWLDQPAAVVERLEPLLSADERARVRRFAFEQLGLDFIVARGLLRTMLGAYLNHDPGQLRFSYSQYGKPAVEQPGSVRQLQFNLSHAHRLMAVAIGLDRQVGVDVEHIRLDLDHPQLAGRVFSAREQAVLRSLPPGNVPHGFFLGWTRKEAYIKAIGEGLSHPLSRFDVTLHPDEPAALVATRPDPAEAGRWRLDGLELPDGYVGAVVAAGCDWRLSQDWWPVS
jgi:4'-phosphopantetheinyl transferase